MRVDEFNLAQALVFAPGEGKLLLGGERMLLFRQQAFELLRGLLHGTIGSQLTRAILSQFGYQCGCGDFESITTMFPWDTDGDRLAAGPAMHQWEGMVRVEPRIMEFDRASGHFYFRGLWHGSYEADVHLRRLGKSDTPVCHALTGYASGWCTLFMGRPILAIEQQCRGRGDPVCEWDIRNEEAWGAEADPWREALRSTETTVSRELQSRLEIIEAQRRAIQELTAPIIQVWDEVLALPVIGFLDGDRAASMTGRMLAAVQRARARFALIDLTGVDTVDDRSAGHLLTLIRALRLLGCTCFVCGISAEVARAMVGIGVELRDLRTFATLHAALAAALVELGLRIERR